MRQWWEHCLHFVSKCLQSPTNEVLGSQSRIQLFAYLAVRCAERSDNPEFCHFLIIHKLFNSKRLRWHKNTLFTRLVTYGIKIKKVKDSYHLAEGEVYLNARRLSIGFHWLLQEALVHHAVTKVVAGKHLTDNIRDQHFNLIFLPLYWSQCLATEEDVVVYHWPSNS